MNIGFNRPSVRNIPLPVLFFLLVALAVAVGTFLLWLPISTSSGEFADWSTALFTAVSAVTVTGLVVVDSAAHWSLFGQIVLILLLFFGGLGFITSVSFLFIAFGQYVSLYGQSLIREDIGGSLGHVLPTVRNIAIMAILVQIIGAGVLFVDFFVVNSLWDGVLWYEALWQALFHSVSAFNNAGFEILPDAQVGGASLIGIGDHYLGISAMMVLTFIGGVSYPFMRDIWVNRGRWVRFNLDTKLVLMGLIGIFLIGGLILFVTEFANNPTLDDKSLSARILNTVFEVVGARTSGLTTIDQSTVPGSAGITNIALMFIGGVTASTAGGIKINTFVVIVLTLFAALLGRERLKIFRRSISSATIRRALILMSFAVIIFFVAQFAMLQIQPELQFLDVAAEAMAALSTAGLGRGITDDLNTANRIVIMIVIVLGRYGPLMLTLNFLNRKRGKEVYQLPEETIRIG